jgi:chemotaxis protein MotB
MALGRTRGRSGTSNYWPGFVDAMATLVLVIIFLLSVFMLAQFYLTQEITGRDTILQRLNRQIAELTELLSLERGDSDELETRIATLQSQLSLAESERDGLAAQLTGNDDALGSAQDQVAAIEAELESERQLTEQALSRVEILVQQISALRRQIASLQAALDASEASEADAQAQISDLGRRLNVALAARVQELESYRSDFFGRLREILSERSDIRVVGDRFVFQSEVLFPVGGEDINPAGEAELERVAAAILEISEQIPTEIDWVLRIDGHTDARPIGPGSRFESNWELSAARAISVAEFLAEQGVPRRRLLAAGFGEYRPLVDGDTDEAYDRNRRIELKLTER